MLGAGLTCLVPGDGGVVMHQPFVDREGLSITFHGVRCAADFEPQIAELELDETQLILERGHFGVISYEPFLDRQGLFK